MFQQDNYVAIVEGRCGDTNTPSPGTPPRTQPPGAHLQPPARSPTLCPPRGPWPSALTPRAAHGCPGTCPPLSAAPETGHKTREPPALHEEGDPDGRKRPRLPPPPPGCLTPLALTFPSRSCYPSTGAKETEVGLEDGGAAGAQVWASFGGRGPWGHPLRARRRPAPRCQRWELTSCPPPVRPIPFRSHKFMLPHLVLELF